MFRSAKFKHTALALGLALCGSLCAQDWPQLLGPHTTGTLESSEASALKIPEKLTAAWNVNVGLGASPVVVKNGKVYTYGLFKPGTEIKDLASVASSFTYADLASGTFSPAELPGTPEHAKKFEYPPSVRGDLYAFCLDAATGKQLWASKFSDAGIAYTTRKHGGTAWEMSSPLIDEQTLYIHTHTGQLFALNAANGKTKWQVNLFEYRMSNWCGGQQGNSSSPLKVGNSVVISYEGGAEKGANPSTFCVAVAAFDAESGTNQWITKAPMQGMNVKTSRISYAVLNQQPTVLCACGGGTMGVDPQNGKIIWAFDLIEANPETMKKVPEKYSTPEKLSKDYKVDAMRTPFPGYAPLVWKNYVLDAACVGHNSLNSAIWCLKIENGQATRVWQTSEIVPLSASKKSNMVVKDGRLYVFDSYFPGFKREYDVTRPYRGAEIGQFQCWDIAMGKRLWHSEELTPETPSDKRVDAMDSLFLIAGEYLILNNSSALCIGKLSETGVKQIARVSKTAAKGKSLAEPVLADGRLYIRQLDAEAGGGVLPALNATGNLICIDLRPVP